MEEKMKAEFDKKALLMLSGGRDSFLAACHMVSHGYKLSLVTYNNGCMSSIENVLTVAERLKQRFGEGSVLGYTVDSCACEFNRLRQYVESREIMELCKSYPHLLLPQVNCLACHTAMYLHAIAQCLVGGVNTIAEGARRQQGFFVELPEMKERYTALCKKYGIALQFPVYDLESDVERKEKLSQWGFTPKSYELQCWVGRPLIESLTNEQRKDLAAFYDGEIEPKLDGMIEELKLIKQWPKVELDSYI